MKISELSYASQIAPKTIRYYESIGLLSSPSRDPNGYRNYSTEAVETLIFIRRCKELNMSLSDIKCLVEAQRHPKASCGMVDELIAGQLRKVRETQKELAELEQTLSTLATSCSSEQIQDCSILNKLKIISV
ncbi:MAG: MerR family transcriptional regulator [Aliidiomarina sp.]|uniref:MerR family transcriptional regulator n=1 Tax=Aliidiomarina sp. TaxID=1872439 RepID=UPI0025C0BC7C|nr:MerR family transcriptional regulator [Aliidiomarina sp.]MCH8502416.1 MerR family transcriptional regulator [Aliidiomarina sp.]